MLTPEELRDAPDEVEEKGDELETLLLILLIRALIEEQNLYRQGMSFAEFQRQVLWEAERFNLTLQPQVRRLMAQGSDAIRGTFESYATRAIANQNRMMINAGARPQDVYGAPTTPPNDDIAARFQIAESESLRRATERAYNATQGTWSNVCGTRAYRTYERFVQACDNAYYLTTQGVMTYREAVQNEIDNLAQGRNPSSNPNIPPASEPDKMVSELSGREERADVAVARAVRTGIGQMVGDMTLKRCEEMGIDTVLVSAHLGARPTHYVWQGKIYSLTGTNYPNFYEETGYGTGEGLCGWNCRHSFGPYLDGMANPYEDMFQDEEENNARYNLEQAQRRRERNIRALKREYEAALAELEAYDQGSIAWQAQLARIDDLEERLRYANTEYIDFCNENGLRPLEERLRLANEYRININGGEE